MTNEDNAPIVCDVKIEIYSKNSGRLSQTIEERLVLQDEAAVSTLDYLLSTLHGEWDEYYIKQHPATCGDCKHCGYEGKKEDVNVNDVVPCPHCVAGTHTDAPACTLFRLRD